MTSGGQGYICRSSEWKSVSCTYFQERLQCNVIKLQPFDSLLHKLIPNSKIHMPPFNVNLLKLKSDHKFFFITIFQDNKKNF